MSVLRQPWRQGGSVHRTLYVDTGEKDPADLFGLVDEAEIAAHIVEIHNWWLGLVLADEAAQIDGPGCGSVDAVDSTGPHPS